MGSTNRRTISNRGRGDSKNLGEGQRKWLREIAIPRVPGAKLKTLSHLIEERGYENYGPYTDRALDLHDYQYHGQDPSGELSKYCTRKEAVRDIIYMIQKIIEAVERIKAAARERESMDTTTPRHANV